MKRIILATVMLLGFSTFTFAQKSAEQAKGPKIVFESLVHDYGTIEKNGNGDCIFTFKNEGTEPLLLANVSASCGCTTPSWTRDPVMPGKTGSIKVHYNTALLGPINKSITVVSNSVDNNREVLRIKGTVKDPTKD